MLVTSFTRAAAAELVGRDLPLPRQNIGTLHAHCYRALNSPDIAELKIHEWNKEHPQHASSGGSKGALDEGAVDQTYQQPADELFAHMQNLRARMIPETAWPASVRSLARIWRQWKADNGLVDFTDMLEMALQDIHIAPGNPSVLIVDEAQDFSKLQLSVVRRWARHTEYTLLAGDDDQCIFCFTGATTDAFLKPDVEADHKRILHQSFRVPCAVHALANQWVQKLTVREPKEYFPRDYGGEVRTCTEGHWRAPEPVVKEAEPYLAAGKTVMFLAACSYMLEPLKEVLRASGMPFHNPYRHTRHDWNPLRNASSGTSTAARMLAFLRPREDVWGAQFGEWRTEELRTWVEIVKTDGLLVRGAKSIIAGMPSDTPIDIELLARLFEPDAAEEMIGVLSQCPLDDCVRWLQNRLLAAKRKAAGYPGAVLLTRGPRALFERPQVIIGTIHCSPPDEPILTKRGWVPIADLNWSDRLVSYHKSCNTVLGGSIHANSEGYEFERSERPYQGQLIVIETEASRTRVTPNHRVVVSFDLDTFAERWAVYLMRRKNWWRVGICTTAHRPYRAGGVSGRLATEQANAGWILGVYERRCDALLAEALIQARYGIPGLTFCTARNRSLDGHDLETIHEMVPEGVCDRVQTLFTDYGLDATWPLYRRDGWKHNLRGLFVTEAANLVKLTGRICMATTDGTRKPTMLRASVSTEDYSGPVFGLDVPPHHDYVSGGAIVHNSVKGGEADCVFLFPDLSRAGMVEWSAGGERRDSVIRQIYVGMTRARESLILCQPATVWHVPIQIPNK